MKTIPFFIIATALALLSSMAAADRVLPLRGGSEIVICRGGALSVLDTESGKTDALGSATVASYDQLSDHLIACNYHDGRTMIRLLSVKDNFKEVLSISIAFRVLDVESLGIADRFYICGTCAKAKKDDPLIWVNFILEFDEATHYVFVHAVPGLSDVIDIPGGADPIVDSARPGTFAYAALVANPQPLIGALKATDSQYKLSSSDCYLVITESWRPWRAWSLSGVSTAYTVGFSQDGKACMIRSSIPSNEEQRYRIFELDTGKSFVCDWLINPMEIVSMNTDLLEEVVSVDNSAPENDRSPELKQLIFDLAQHGARQTELSQASLLVVIGKNTGPVLLKAYRDSPNFAGAYCREKQSYVVSDGTRLLTISHGKIVRENKEGP